MLVDGIYPEISQFVKAFSQPVGEKASFFTLKQESARKDVERAFGVLQSRFAILTTPSKLWYMDDMMYVIRCCICLHNFIIERRGNSITESMKIDMSLLRIKRCYSIEWLKQGLEKLYNPLEYLKLQQNLMEHLWIWRGTQ